MTPAKKATKSSKSLKDTEDTEEEPTSEALGEEGFYMVNHRTISFEEDLVEDEDDD